MSNTHMISKVVGAFKVIYMVGDNVLIMSPAMPSRALLNNYINNNGVIEWI